MKRLFLSLFMTASVWTLHAGSDTLSLKSIFLENKFAVQSVPGFNVMNDGKTFTKIEKSGNTASINAYDLQSGTFLRTIFQTSDVAFTNTIWSQDESKILLLSKPTPIYRRSVKHDVTIVSGGQLLALPHQQVLHPTFNPQGTKVAYVYENNLYIYDITAKKVTAITKDGKWNHIINGNCDWVYEEEFGFSQAYEWSPTGDYLAYYRFDESKVKEFSMDYYWDGDNYPDRYTFKYPKAGEANSVVNIYVYNVNTQQSVKSNIGKETDIYIPRIKWIHENNLGAYHLNRHQNHLNILAIDPVSGSSKTFYEEKNQYYIDINDNVAFLDNGNKMIYTSEKSGYNHLHIWDAVAKKDVQLTKGNWEIDKLVSIDTKSNEVYFTAGKNDPLNREFYSVNYKSQKSQELINQPGMLSISPCNGNNYFLVKHQTNTKVPEFFLIDKKGNIVRNLQDNAKLQQTVANYTLGKVHYTTIPANGTVLNAYQILPADFDSTKKYPVLMYQYSGPGSQQVLNQFQLDSYMWHQYLAQKGYIVTVVDGRGTGARGEHFKKQTYLQLGKLESDDQIAAAQYLANQKYVDASRIGIWGWSYGGFMSSICIMKAPETFKTAIAVAPVTNWRFYDNIYTERYMRTPQENPQGYDDNAPEQMAANLKGNYLLIHGLGDDNVHFQNAAVMTRQLIEHGKQFESTYYPNGNHGIGGGKIRYQLYQKMTNYILNNL